MFVILAYTVCGCVWNHADKVIDFPKQLVAEKGPFFLWTQTCGCLCAFAPLRKSNIAMYIPRKQNIGNPKNWKLWKMFFPDDQSGDFQVSVAVAGLGTFAARSMDRSALNKATSADDTPTPGYLYTEILGKKS